MNVEDWWLNHGRTRHDHTSVSGLPGSEPERAGSSPPDFGILWKRPARGGVAGKGQADIWCGDFTEPNATDLQWLGRTARHAKPKLMMASSVREASLIRCTGRLLFEMFVKDAAHLFNGRRVVQTGVVTSDDELRFHIVLMGAGVG